MEPWRAAVVPAWRHPAWAASPAVPSRHGAAGWRNHAAASRVVRAPLAHRWAAVPPGEVPRRRGGRRYTMTGGPPGAEAGPSSPLPVAHPTSGTPPPLIPPRRRLRPLRVVLVAPEGPLNVGSVARVMKNFGSAELYLVNPVHPPCHPDSVLFAPHAGGVLAAATVVPTVAEALAGGVRTVVATTARVRDAKRGEDVLVPPRVAAAVLAASEQAAAARERESPRASADDVADTASTSRATTAVLFGPESRGLSNEEMASAQLLVAVRTVDRDGSYDSMNLSHAVGVVLYELSGAAEGGLLPLGRGGRRAEAEGGGGPAAASSPTALLPPPSPSKATAMEAATATATASAATVVVVPADAARRARLAEKVERLLDAVGYFRSSASRSAAALNVRRLLMRAALSDDDVTLLLGAVRRVERVVRLALWGGGAGERGEGGKGEELGGRGKRRERGRR